ncbi:retrotransposon protein, putative, ty1-copia subclass [Tanacetum coccineum]|uniref:Retrotransposon protein, putative, ty1-copia subclass n=1 Tax=Tanacetum coccineum TaxID=301880 RepID=A0ABQ4XU14_9ASTR
MECWNIRLQIGFVCDLSIRLFGNDGLNHPFIGSCERGEGLLDLVHTYVCGPFRSTTKDGKCYYVTFTDAFSRHGYVYLIKHKLDTFEVFKRNQNKVENQLGRKIKKRSQDKLEAISEKFIFVGYPEESFRYLFYKPKDNVSLLADEEPMCTLTINKSGDTVKQMNIPLHIHEQVEEVSGWQAEAGEWIFKKKIDMDGKVHTYKARLVMKGYTQTHGIDYEENFSPVAKIKSIRIMLAIAMIHDYEICQMDVKTAFLNEKVTEDVFMAQPEGFENAKYPKRVCKLQKAIYGLKTGFRSGISVPCGTSTIWIF